MRTSTPLILAALLMVALAPTRAGAQTGPVSPIAQQAEAAGASPVAAAALARAVAKTPAQEAKLTAADAAERDRFGISVSLSGARALIGAYFDDDAGESSGSAYVFLFDGATWTQEAKLTASDAVAFDQFGYSVSLSDDRALVGAYFDDDAGESSGSAYVFAFDGATWSQEAKLTANDAEAFDRFGYSVSLSDERALVGAPLDDDAGTDSGSAYVFAHDGGAWVQEAKLIADDAAENEVFGGAVSLLGERALVSALGEGGMGEGSGSAYVFQLAPAVANETAPTGEVTLASVPNPAHGAMTVTLLVPTAQSVTVEVFDAIGRRVATLHNGPAAAGPLPLSLDASGLPSGVYVVRAAGEGVSLSERFTVVR